MTMNEAKMKSALASDNLTIINDRLLAKSAVLVPLIETDSGEWIVLFQVRASHLKRQPGEVCFPGGALDGPEESPRQAARRETCEELGLRPEEIYIWGQLGLIISPFNLLLFSFVGEIPPAERLNPNSNEVAAVFTVPLARLLSLKPETYPVYVKASPAVDFPFDKIPGGRDYPWRTGVVQEVFYELDGRIIWGLTARILQHFLTLVRNT